MTTHAALFAAYRTAAARAERSCERLAELERTSDREALRAARDEHARSEAAVEQALAAMGAR